MCYRDRTFCSASCATVECSRQITPEVTAAAQHAGLPLAVSDLRDWCLKYRAPEPAPAAPETERKETDDGR